jgi:uncharacterized membrane protein
MIVGLGVFLYGLFAKSDDVKRASLMIFFGIALISIPTFVTGTAAELALEKNPDVNKAMVNLHETAAFIALGFMELTGVLSWLGLWQYRRRSRVPQATIGAVLILGLLTFGLMSRAATMGGEIRHAEIRTGPVPTYVEDGPQPLARVIGDGMVNLRWGWPASETIHFIGLSLLFGVVLLIDLRMLGFMKGIPYSTLHRLLPWGVLGFAVNVVTGMLFFIGAPTNFYVTNEWFFYKLGMILVAGANALYFTVYDGAWAMEAGDAPPFTARVAAASGIALWLGIIFCGQMLPFLGHSF